MDYSQVELKVKEVLADKLNLDAGKINLNSRLTKDLGMDSFGSIEVIFELEEKFGIKIPEAEVEKTQTVKDIVDYVFALTGAGK